MGINKTPSAWLFCTASRDTLRRAWTLLLSDICYFVLAAKGYEVTEDILLDLEIINVKDVCSEYMKENIYI